MKKYYFLVFVFSISVLFNTYGSNSAKDTVVFTLSKPVAGYISVDVSFTAAESITSMDFSLKFDLKKLTYDSLLKRAYYLDEALGYFNTTDSTLRVTSYSSTYNYVPNKSLISLVFSVKSTVLATDFYSIKGFLNGNQVPVKFQNSTAGITEIQNDALIRVYPNPAGSFVNINVSDSRLRSFDLELYDVNQKKVFERKGMDSNAHIDLHSLSNGIYTMMIHNSKYSSLKKIVINK